MNKPASQVHYYCVPLGAALLAISRDSLSDQRDGEYSPRSAAYTREKSLLGLQRPSRAMQCTGDATLPQLRGMELVL